jgi:hypothetical protein
MESEATSQTSKQTTIVVIFQEPIEKFFRPPEPEGTHEPRNRFPGNSPTKRRNKSTVSLGNNVASWYIDVYLVIPVQESSAFILYLLFVDVPVKYGSRVALSWSTVEGDLVADLILQLDAGNDRVLLRKVCNNKNQTGN